MTQGIWALKLFQLEMEKKEGKLEQQVREILCANTEFEKKI